LEQTAGCTPIEGEEVSGMDATESGLAAMMLEERPVEVVQDLKRRVRVLEEQIAALGGDVADLRRQNAGLEKDRGELMALLEAWQAHAADLEGRLIAAGEQLSDQDRMIEDERRERSFFTAAALALTVVSDRLLEEAAECPTTGCHPLGHLRSDRADTLKQLYRDTFIEKATQAGLEDPLRYLD
jgi:hypothetical protein